MIRFPPNFKRYQKSQANSNKEQATSNKYRNQQKTTHTLIDACKHFCDLSFPSFVNNSVLMNAQDQVFSCVMFVFNVNIRRENFTCVIFKIKKSHFKNNYKNQKFLG